jgi:pimeloyl-ACP methyl ester carboxylesterase
VKNEAQATSIRVETKSVRANGIDIHYTEAGHGPPLLLLHGGVVSTNPLWAGHPCAYVSPMAQLAEHFRVIAPDTRGCGKTVHPGEAPITFDLLAEDILAMMQALGVDRPAICGFSEGALTATIVGIREPKSIRALVNDAGYDAFNPNAPSLRLMRQMLGGHPEATSADPEAAARFFTSSPERASTFELVKRDQDGSQGPGHWRTYFRLAFARTTRSPGYMFDDLAKIAAPTLILVGDRDHFCSVEEGAVAYRKLARGELAVLPNVGHTLPPAAIDATIDFLVRQQR